VWQRRNHDVRRQIERGVFVETCRAIQPKPSGGLERKEGAWPCVQCEMRGKTGGLGGGRSNGAPPSFQSVKTEAGRGKFQRGKVPDEGFIGLSKTSPRQTRGNRLLNKKREVTNETAKRSFPFDKDYRI